MTQDLRAGGLAVIDYGSQYTQLIARRVRELGVYAEVFPYDAPPEQVNQHQPRGYILSGGPGSVYDADAYPLADYIPVAGLPLLGVCYGMQALAQAFGGRVEAGHTREYGDATITHRASSPLFDGLPAQMPVWMSHGDHVTQLPPGFSTLAESGSGILAAMGFTGSEAVAFGANALVTINGSQFTHTSHTLDSSVHGIDGLEVTVEADAHGRLRRTLSPSQRIRLRRGRRSTTSSTSSTTSRTTSRRGRRSRFRAMKSRPRSCRISTRSAASRGTCGRGRSRRSAA
ncbi:C26 family cysteine hydrolase domain-containing family [bacterium]|nr:C26 family cysteine hydrolase domain-containing family [bacterium]